MRIESASRMEFRRQHEGVVVRNDDREVARIEGGFITIADGGRWQDGKPNKLFISTDEGKTWQRIDTGLPLVRDIQDIVQAGNYLFCSTDAGIFRTADSGKTPGAGPAIVLCPAAAAARFVIAGKDLDQNVKQTASKVAVE